ncbi:ATP-dependent nuclease [Vibrio mangrovi]|uniref:AAA family ATPase n=1 Tax=Vibrio mangrovi TaxID=474394 RepID=A0A1Y6ITU5_9VIBR|nr:AAA family ATPase [Vibrio mangrovi]MDW6003308.1 AAA family ATPase [Vibrio mangrovi]SMR99902.1 DNA replication and repair protein RecF [Vibrio mangrovi]
MALSKEVRKLAAKWQRGDFPKHLEWIELDRVRGWSGQRTDFNFPIVAICGENGAGKSTIIQAVASIYESTTAEKYFASTFFPDTAWDSLTGVVIKASVKEGQNSTEVSVRKPTTRWRGNDTRRKRPVIYLDLRRIQPISARTGYARLAKSALNEASSTDFATDSLQRLSSIIGKSYASARQATTNLDQTRNVPVVSHDGTEYSGFHQGAGEATVADLISIDIPQYSIVLVDEIETSLHPRAQRRLIRDLAEISRIKLVQFVITTHSPYVLEELPASARVYVFKNGAEKCVVPGVSAQFALSKMDEEIHPEIDVYVEDNTATILIEEIMARKSLGNLSRCLISPFGAASVGKSLGQMVEGNRFSRPTVVILDADQDPAPGCMILPGEDAPERQLFEDLQQIAWQGISPLINRSHSDFVSAAENALTLPDHHEWIKSVADRITIGTEELWRAMCRVWLDSSADETVGDDIIERIDDLLNSDIQEA